jgi:Sulfatase
MSSPDRHVRAMLPIPDRPAPGLTTYDAKDPDSSFPPIEPLLPPQGAPNVLVVLLDDVGFGASSAFGGPCRTPTAERLANGGLRYNRFHTTALCAPTRQALLTGRNHHSVGMGSITETATSAPGYCSLRPNTKAPLPMTLKLNGYSTAQFGKCHEVPVWQTSPLGPFDAWPTGGGGFEAFYGFVGGEANQWEPALYEGTTPVEAPATAVLPMDDRLAERVDPAVAGRPTLIRGRSQQFFPGMGRLSENSVVSMKNTSFSVTADVDVPPDGVQGVVIAQGGRFGGWALYATGGRLAFCYNVLGIQHFVTRSDVPVPGGDHQLRVEFAYDGGGVAKGGDVTLFHDGVPVGAGRVDITQPAIFSADETTDIGYDSGTAVSPDYTCATSRFTGRLRRVQLDLGDADEDHFLDPDEWLRIAMARQ